MRFTKLSHTKVSDMVVSNTVEFWRKKIPLAQYFEQAVFGM